MKVLSDLSEILECERGFGGRVVQKYIELPLTAPMTMTSAPSLLNGSSCKFDLRIWVLVTSFSPLQAHIYTHVYGRKCSSVCSLKSLADAQLNDASVHLTNYSLQRRILATNIPAASSSKGSNHDDVISSKLQGIGKHAYNDDEMGLVENINTQMPSSTSPRNPVNRLRSVVGETRQQAFATPQGNAITDADLFMGKYSAPVEN
jgi:hypothetical protein